MANIYDGSYVLGDVSATQIVAGEGIKIDTTEPGVIKVSNDETVLWSANSVQSAANLSEPMTAFDYVKVYYADDFTDTGRYHTVAQLDPNFGAHEWQPLGGLGEAGCWIGCTYFSANNDYTTLVVPKVKLIKFATWASTATGANAITTVTTGANVNVLYKIIGINRKQNGGN